MALSQFGGRPGSGSGSATAGKEIGEVFLVPQTFVSSDVVDAGETIVNNDYPLLYPKLVNGAVTNNFITQNWPLSDGAITNVRIAASAHHNGATYIVTWDGKVASSQDGNSWTARGKVASPSDSTFPLLWSTAISSVTTQKPNVFMYSTGPRLVIINYNARYCAGFYTDDNGSTWIPFNDVTINNVLTVTTTALNFIGTTTGAAVLVDIISKKIYRSANGTTGWVDVTGAAVIPTSTAAPSVYFDASIVWFWIANTAFTSLDGGLTFTSSTFTAAAAPNSIVRWNSALYCILYSAAAQPIYKSVDNGVTWTASGTVTTTSGAWSVLVPGSDGNIGAVSLTNCYKSTDGAAWTTTSPTVIVNNYATSYGAGFLVKNAGTGYTAVFPTSAGGNVRTTSGSYGAPWTVANPIWFTGLDIPGIWATDSATSTSGVTVLPCNPCIREGGRGSGGQTHTAFLNTNESMQSNVAYVGSWDTGFQAVTLPVMDIWHGITYNAAAGLFILTGSLTDAVYTSPDGITWTTIALGSLPQSAKLCTPRTAGPVTYFIPYATGTLAMMMFVARPDGSTYFFKTPFTHTAWGVTFADNAAEILDGIVALGTSSSKSYFIDPRILTNATSTGVSVPASPSWASSTSYVVTHKNIAVARPSSAGTISTAVYGDRYSTTPPLVNVGGVSETARQVAVLEKGGVLHLYYSTKQVATSTDLGVTWSAKSNLTSISVEDPGIVFGRTYGDGTVVLFGGRGTYIYNSTATGTDPLSKTLNNGWVAPAGLKYVVKAK